MDLLFRPAKRSNKDLEETEEQGESKGTPGSKEPTLGDTTHHPNELDTPRDPDKPKETPGDNTHREKDKEDK